MKKVTFSKLTMFGYRPEFPGYLLEHPAHPTRKFVIAAVTFPTNPGDPLREYGETGEWGVYDLESGVPLSKLGITPERTRHALRVKARNILYAISEARIAERVSDFRSLVATKILKGETP